jgi:hypothetical protein
VAVDFIFIIVVGMLVENKSALAGIDDFLVGKPTLLDSLLAA